MQETKGIINVMLTTKRMKESFSMELTASMSMLNVAGTKWCAYQNTPLKTDFAASEKRETNSNFAQFKNSVL